MKKKIVIVLICCIVLGVFVSQFLVGKHPFKKLTISDIDSVTLLLSPPEVSITLTQEQIEKFVPLLCELVIYQRDDSYTEYNGQNCIFTVTKTDGSQFKVNCGNPFVIINGYGYRTKYAPCYALNRFGNSLIY